VDVAGSSPFARGFFLAFTLKSLWLICGAVGPYGRLVGRWLGGAYLAGRCDGSSRLAVGWAPTELGWWVCGDM
jgi:hypothetical protein